MIHPNITVLRSRERNGTVYGPWESTLTYATRQNWDPPTLQSDLIDAPRSDQVFIDGSLQFIEQTTYNHIPWWEDLGVDGSRDTRFWVDPLPNSGQKGEILDMTTGCSHLPIEDWLCHSK